MQYHIEVTIGLKDGMLDPAAATIKKALEHLGYPTDSLQMQKKFIIDLNEASSDEAYGKVDEMCKRLLANPVIHNYNIVIEESV
ncbi:MAG: phosphoribosylformylglycinamidine synthase subunit PurS [Methanosarcinales archaeon]|jgi:phosphoribosylformylglycinamidine synthase